MQYPDGERIPDVGVPETQRELDVVFLKLLFHRVWKDATKKFLLVIPHLTIGFFAILTYFAIVRLTHRLWFEHNLPE